MNKNLITVFTPTYNRAYILEDLYQSLVLQSNRNFEWLIVDDGSTDNTEELVKSLKKGAPFTIKYFKRENGGKHRAINQGVKLAEGFLFFIVDSDDQLTPDAIEKLFTWDRDLEEKENYAGLSGNRGDKFGKLLGATFTGKYIDATNIERKKYNILGDKAEAYYTNILKKFPFPEVKGELFMTEDIVWDRIALSGFKIRWYNDIIYISEHRPDGLIAQGNLRYANSPEGYAMYVLQREQIFHIQGIPKLYSGYYYYDTVKSKVSLLQAAKLLKRNSILYVTFWLWQSVKVLIKRRLF